MDQQVQHPRRQCSHPGDQNWQAPDAVGNLAAGERSDTDDARSDRERLAHPLDQVRGVPRRGERSGDVVGLRVRRADGEFVLPVRAGEPGGKRHVAAARLLAQSVTCVYGLGVVVPAL